MDSRDVTMKHERLVTYHSLIAVRAAVDRTNHCELYVYCSP